MLRHFSSKGDHPKGGFTLPPAVRLTVVISCLALGACVESATPSDTGGTGGSGAKGGSGGSAGKPMGSGGSSGGEMLSCTSDAAPGDMVSVKAGDFAMGCNEAIDDQCDDDETPQHTVTLAAFEIDVTEVTQEQYSACVAAGACPEPACAWDCSVANLPATCVDWTAASSYCAWANKRLPTEAEWEKAARGSDGQKYPWGNADPDCSLTNMLDCAGGPMPVGSLEDGASPYGALDMAGNVVELVADFYDANYYADSPAENPTGPAQGSRYGGRGGGFKSEAVWQRASKRDWYDGVDEGPSLGFRCAR
jgi:formylglycine-generating enzyme required for sulfatase activity